MYILLQYQKNTKTKRLKPNGKHYFITAPGLSSIWGGWLMVQRYHKGPRLPSASPSASSTPVPSSANSPRQLPQSELSSQQTQVQRADEWLPVGRGRGGDSEAQATRIQNILHSTGNGAHTL